MCVYLLPSIKHTTCQKHNHLKNLTIHISKNNFTQDFVQSNAPTFAQTVHGVQDRTLTFVHKVANSLHLYIIYINGDQTMPMYEYKCCDCCHEFEELAGIDELPPCPKCKSAKVEKLMSATAIKTGDSAGAMPDLGGMPPMGGGCGGGG